VNWKKVNTIRHELVKDSISDKSLFTQLKEALEVEDYTKASNLQIEIDSKIKMLKTLYSEYKANIINL
jgi:glutamine synthetase